MRQNAAEIQRRYRARKRGEDVPIVRHPGRKPVSDDDPRRERARAMYASGVGTKVIRAQLRLRWEILSRWLQGVERGVPLQAEQREIVPPPYASGHRWTNTKWA